MKHVILTLILVLGAGSAHAKSHRQVLKCSSTDNQIVTVDVVRKSKKGTTYKVSLESNGILQDIESEIFKAYWGPEKKAFEAIVYINSSLNLFIPIAEAYEVEPKARLEIAGSASPIEVVCSKGQAFRY